MSEISELKEAIVSFADKMNQRFNDMEGRFDTLEGRFDTLEGRFDTLEGRFYTLENRFDKLENRFDQFESNVISEFRNMGALIGRLHAENDARFDRIEQRLDKIESDMKIRWIAPDMAIRLEAVENTVAKHSEQLAKLTS